MPDIYLVKNVFLKGDVLNSFAVMQVFHLAININPGSPAPCGHATDVIAQAFALCADIYAHLISYPDVYSLHRKHQVRSVRHHPDWLMSCITIWAQMKLGLARVQARELVRKYVTIIRLGLSEYQELKNNERKHGKLKHKCWLAYM